MRIYVIGGDFDHYDSGQIYSNISLSPPGALYGINVDVFDRNAYGDRWVTSVVLRDCDRPLGDYLPCFDGGTLIMERTAIEKLHPVFGRIEVLPLRANFGDYWAVNVLTVLDCIDYENAEYECFDKKYPNEIPRIICFGKYAFRPEALLENHVFRIVNKPKSVIFVDDVFVNEVRKQNITGFKFDLVWLDEPVEELKKSGRGSMTDADLVYIEETLDIKLPETYKAAMRNNRLWKYDLDRHILADPKEIVKLNRRMRKRLPGGVCLKPEHFVFAYRNGEVFECRFLNLKDLDSPVYLFLRGKWKYNPDSIEGHKECASLDDYISGILKRKGFSDYEKKCAEG